MSINNANDNTSASNKQMETLEELLIRTINIGAPIYNKGDKRGCYELYIEAAKHACSQPQLFKAAVGQLLESATEEAGKEKAEARTCCILKNPRATPSFLLRAMHHTAREGRNHMGVVRMGSGWGRRLKRR